MGSSPLRMLLVALCFATIGCNRSNALEETKKTTPLMRVVDESKSVPICTSGTFEEKLARVRRRGPKLANLISKLYREARSAPEPSARLIKFIKKEHDKKLGPNLPVWSARLYAYAVSTYSKEDGVNRDYYISLVTHENGWVNSRGDTSIDGKPQPRFKWSWGLGQVQFRTADSCLKSLGCSGLVEQDLVDFPLLNLYVVGKVLRYKVNIHGGYGVAIQSYNAGDNGWVDGRSRNYLDKVTAIYNRRAEWSNQ